MKKKLKIHQIFFFGAECLVSVCEHHVSNLIGR